MLTRMLATAMIILVSLFSAPVAVAAPDQASRADVLEALGVAAQPADYVVVVDTSGSMRDDDRYTRVTSALRSLLTSLNPTDHVSLVTFDSEAKVVFRGDVGRDPLAALKKLPARPEGARTDIGAGIEAGLTELERGSAKQTGAIALITDGLVDAPDSDYEDPDSPAWGALQSRAEKLTQDHEIAAYAVALQSRTDAALLRQVFPGTLDVTGNELGKRLGGLDEELLRFQAVDRLRPDLAQGVSGTWLGVDWARLAPEGGTTPATLTLTSGFERIPVVVEGLGVAASGDLPVTVEGLPATASLAPGESVELPVTITWLAAPSGVSSLTVTGTVASPWQDVLTGEFGLSFAPILSATQEVRTDGPRPTAQTFELPPQLPLYLGIAAAVAALTAATVVVSHRRHPKLTGSLEIRRDGALVRAHLLHGRRVPLTEAAATVPGARGWITGVPGSRDTGSGSIRVRGKLDGHPLRSVLVDGEPLQLGGLTLMYTTEHSRALSMINAGTPQHERG